MFEDDTMKKVEDSNCDAAKKYEDSRNCTGELEECLGEWFSGPWSKVKLTQTRNGIYNNLKVKNFSVTSRVVQEVVQEK